MSYGPPGGPLKLGGGGCQTSCSSPSPLPPTAGSGPSEAWGRTGGEESHGGLRGNARTQPHPAPGLRQTLSCPSGVALQPWGHGRTLGSGHAPTLPSSGRVWWVQALKSGQGGHGVEPTPHCSPRSLNPDNQNPKGRRMAGGGEDCGPRIPHQPQQKGEEATANEGGTNCSDGETPQRRRGGRASPSSICLCLSPSLSLSLPSVFLSLAHPPSPPPTLSPPHLSPPLSPSLSRTPLQSPPAWRKRRRKRGRGWGVSLRPNPGQFPFRSHLCRSRGGGDCQARPAGALGMGAPRAPWPLVWAVLQLGWWPGWLLGTWVRSGWHGVRAGWHGVRSQGRPLALGPWQVERKGSVLAPACLTWC